MLPSAAWSAAIPRLAAIVMLAVRVTGPPAAAQTLTVSGACQRQCGAVSPTVRNNAPDLRACLIRCNAGQEFAQAGAARVWRAPRQPGVPPAPPLPPAGPAKAAVAGAAAAGWGVVYLATAPGSGFGLSVDSGDRMAAHGAATTACALGGAPCHAVLEFRDRCGAVAQARHTLGLYRTSDPSTYSVSYAAGGAGPTQGLAEAAALEECRARERTSRCEIAVSLCGRP